MQGKRRKEEAILEDHADILILSCGTLLGPGNVMVEILKREGIRVPVINPTPLAINVMAAVLRSGLTHSKLAFPCPFPGSTEPIKQLDHA